VTFEIHTHQVLLGLRERHEEPVEDISI
jgi:hypothetical protein